MGTWQRIVSSNCPTVAPRQWQCGAVTNCRSSSLCLCLALLRVGGEEGKRLRVGIAANIGNWRLEGNDVNKGQRTGLQPTAVGMREGREEND